ncbi:uronyl 2-sulfotransferase-like [Oscarella lobularis]|uniref:uronyl 2-sulfotransferase-like n=1 Tax=Oscarella lobularis TaxID=121494 RepID=UPI003313720C
MRSSRKLQRFVMLSFALGMALVGPILIVMTGSPVKNHLSEARRQYEHKNRLRIAQNALVFAQSTANRTEGEAEDEEEDESQARIMYNRVGKCGSRTTLELLKVLADRNDFVLATSDINNQKAITVQEQIDLVNYIYQLPIPFIYSRHLFFIDFQKYGALPLVHINIIRDPIERFVSNFYYKRFGDNRENHTVKFSERRVARTVDECVQFAHHECTSKRLFYITPFFCGQEPACFEPGMWALNRAKTNVIEKYLVVGLLEEYEDTLRVFERLLPRHFHGVVDLYKHPGAETGARINTTATKKKVMPSLETRRILRFRMHFDYEFYFFVQERFQALKKELGIGT